MLQCSEPAKQNRAGRPTNCLLKKGTWRSGSRRHLCDPVRERAASHYLLFIQNGLVYLRFETEGCSMRRREFITLFGGATAAWPLTVQAQPAAPPVAGFLSALTQGATDHLIAAWRRGLRETGFIDGKNVAIEYRFANGRYDRLPALAIELVGRPVSVIVAAAPSAAIAAKMGTTTIPIVFVVGLDPVAAGLVESFNHPGRNATGMTLITGPLGQKRLEILRELAPKVKVVPLLVNPTSPDAVPELRDIQAAAQRMRLELRLFNASTPNEIDSAFGILAEQRPDGLLVGSDPFFVIEREHLTASAARLGVPTVYPFREFVAAGGLVSYGTSIANAYRQAGIYTGRILKGDKPGDLPVMQPTTFELVINLKTALSLGIDIPATLHARSDEVIE
jgi:putative ABC transport system substrate-binding protein